MTEAIYLEVTEMAKTAHKAKRRVSVSGMLKHLGVSRSSYHAWLKRVPSNTEKRRESVKAKIQDIYDESKQNYGCLLYTSSTYRGLVKWYDRGLQNLWRGFDSLIPW